MGTRGRKASSSAQELRAAVDDVIAECLERDPDRVARVLEAVVERCKEEGRYPADEIDAAAAQLRREFALLPRKVN
jgi:uracil-DNA glycosylase